MKEACAVKLQGHPHAVTAFGELACLPRLDELARSWQPRTTNQSCELSNFPSATHDTHLKAT
jgi:hypothetical protein